ncbi:MAG: hypothetical protein ACRCWM_05760 [Sarcina sp.]
MKKGHLILEVVIYIGLVGILLIPVMNIGLFLFENYNKEKRELQNKINFIQLNNTVEKYIEEAGTEVCIETSIQGNNYLTVRDFKKKTDLYKVELDKWTGLVVKIYNNSGGLIKSIGINHDVKEFNISENKNLVYVEYVFKNGYKDIGVYEK